MRNSVIIPAQIRAGRALLNWRQEQLAEEAGVALSSVRDIEGQKRDAAPETIGLIRHALEKKGVVFVPGNAKEGPGVRLAGDRPNIIRRPTMVTTFDGIPFTAEWQGRRITVLVSREAVADLGELRSGAPRSAYLETFAENEMKILQGVIKAASDPDNFDRDGRLVVRGCDIFGR